MIDYEENEKEAYKFVSERFAKISELLDEVAQETGQLYAVMPMNVIGSFARLGARWGQWMIDAQKLCAKRLVLAESHEDWMLNRHASEKGEDRHAEASATEP